MLDEKLPKYYLVKKAIVEKCGWLELGGYRVGIRSDKGAYMYYAHLAQYAGN